MHARGVLRGILGVLAALEADVVSDCCAVERGGSVPQPAMPLHSWISVRRGKREVRI
jgi:hypothetical protein